MCWSATIWQSSTHMCSAFAVMQAGKIVEVLTRDALDAGQVSAPYTRALLEASGHYDLAAPPSAQS